MKIYQVGGSIRDKLLNKTSNDIDFACECGSFEELITYLKKEKFEIILEKPEFLTVKVKKESHVYDFTVCRKDSKYDNGRHPSSVTIGTIYDDLSRRDFTINSIAMHKNNIIDPHNGIDDIKNKIIRCVESIDRIKEDGLRVLRALRFAIQLDFKIDDQINQYLLNEFDVSTMRNVSSERIKQELTKMLKIDCYKTVNLLSKYQKVLQFLLVDKKIKIKVI